MARAKDPAAVALGKKRQAKMTADEREQFRKVAAEVKARRTIQERRAIARKSALTRRLGRGGAAIPIERAPAADELARLAQAIDELPDDMLERLTDALSSRIA
jgi:hypothetical protein